MRLSSEGGKTAPAQPSMIKRPVLELVHSKLPVGSEPEQYERAF